MRTKKGITVPADVARALKGVEAAWDVFEAMRPSCQIEYANWVDGSRNKTTRMSRLGRLPSKILTYGRRHNLLED